MYSYERTPTWMAHIHGAIQLLKLRAPSKVDTGAKLFFILTEPTTEAAPAESGNNVGKHECD